MLTETIKNWIFKIDNQFNLGLCQAMGIHVEYDIDAAIEEALRVSEKLHKPFRLPITYLPPEEVRPLPKIVSSDLELAITESSNTTITMYDYLLKPQHQFARNLISDWNQHFTTHGPFLEDSQRMIHNMGAYLETMKPAPEQPIPSSEEPNVTLSPPPRYEFTEDKCNKIMGIWTDIKEDPNFLEKYGYIEWEWFMYLNKSPAFLQTLSIINMSSPIMSFIVPIVFLVFPFVILKIQGIPITFPVYIKVLKDIARNHFIGKTISNIQKLSWDKLIYLIITAGLYFLQIYQNITICYRFYRNIAMINTHLAELRDFMEYSMRSMDTFTELNHSLPTYAEFHRNTFQHREAIGQLHENLKSLKPFQPGFTKIVEIGYLLRHFYEVYNNEEFGRAIRYAIGFEGYMNNLQGIHENLVSRRIAMAKFSQSAATTQMQQLYYPAYVNERHVKNSCDLSNNMIITGPNASGKTTMLKAVTINLIFTQQFGCGFYGGCTLAPYTHIHSYLNIPDTSGRDSLFQAESRRCKEIINIIHEPWGQADASTRQARHFCIFDELYSGTNPTEASKSAYAFLLYLSKYKHVDFILTTHYVKLCKKLEKKLARFSAKSPGKYREVSNYKMAVIENPETQRIQYSYKMKRGISKIQGAILILEDMCYPAEIIAEVKRSNKSAK